MGRRRKTPEEPAAETEFSSSRRAADAWADSPKSWRRVQAEQLHDDLAGLREPRGNAEPDGAPDNGRRSRRLGFMRRFSH